MIASARRRRPALRLGVVAIALVVTSAGCTDGAAGELEHYEPSDTEEVEGSELKRVTFTSVGAEAVGLRTAVASQSGQFTVVDYESLIYDGQGVPWVYTVPEELTFLRAQVVVDRVEDDRVLLSDGLTAGTRVVTTGATEVYGTELDIAGSH